MKYSSRSRVCRLFVIALLFAMGTLPQFASGGELEDAISRVEQAGKTLMLSAKKPDAREEIRSVLQFDQLDALIATGTNASRKNITLVRDHFINNLGDLKGKYAKQAEQIRQSLESWIQVLPSKGLKEILAQIKSDPPAFTAVTQEHVLLCRAKLDTAIQNLEAFLDANDSQVDWKSHLNWQTLKTELGSNTPSPAKLQPVLVSFFGNVEGLERPEFTNTRLALRDFMNAVYFASNARIKDMYAAQLNNIETALESYLVKANNDDAWAIGRAAGWLERANQATDLQNELRQQFNKPNIYMQISQNLLAAGGGLDVEETQDIEQDLKGIAVKGVATMKGNINFQMVNDPLKASLDVMLSGKITTDNVAQKSGVTVFTQGLTDIEAQKRISFSEDGFSTLPARASGSTKLELVSIDAPSSVYENAAKTKFFKGRKKNEAAATEIAVEQVAQNMDGQVRELLKDVIDGYHEKVRKPLQRRGGFPVNVSSSSTTEDIQLNLLQTRRYQIASPSEPPALNNDTDVALRIHESFLRNISEVILGGEVLDDTRVREIIESVGAEVPEELKEGPGKKSWAITFSTAQPLSVNFRDGQVEIAVKGREFRDGERTIKESIRIAAVYNVVKTDNGMRLTRDGDVKIDFVGRKSLTTFQVAMRTIMRRKFGAFFKEEMAGQGGIPLPGAWADAGNLMLQQLISDDGWLMLSYKLGEPAAE